jgi:hypothetical protein
MKTIESIDGKNLIIGGLLVATLFLLAQCGGVG